MIADSPYQAEDLILTPWAGAASGALAAMVMVTLVGFEQPLGSVLGAVGRVVVPDAWTHPGWRGGLLGLGVQAAVGAVLGLLYASSQRQAPPAATLVTSLVFGVMIWVGARVLTLFAFSALRELIHSWLWFFSSLIYGALLGGVAVLSRRFRPSASTVILKD